MVVRESAYNLQSLQWLIQVLEKKGHLNRELEWIPSDAVLTRRMAQGGGLTRPEAAVLLAYSKQWLKTDLRAEMGALDKKIFKEELTAYFPPPLQQRFGQEIQKHRLANEIVANQLVNSAIDRLGITFPYRLMEETSCSTADLVNTYKSVCKIMNFDGLWSMQQDLDELNSLNVQTEIQQTIRKNIERAMYWFLRNEPLVDSDASAERAELYSRAMNELTNHIIQLLPDSERKTVDQAVAQWMAQGIASVLAVKVATLDFVFLCLDAVKVHARHDYELHDVAKTLFYLLSELNLTWLRKNIAQLPRDSMWDSLARRSMMEVFDTVCCELTVEILQQNNKVLSDRLNTWRENNSKAIERYHDLVAKASADSRISLDKITVILKELAGLRIEK